ncbi:MAG TPA: acyl-CoA dehydrogenase family protein [Deferrisomatales bacterium]|nr:acyl-CoA dehydrogenase family protein [Deferrisomatales bacterium]
MALCFELGAEENILRQSVREFAEKEIRPVARELDAKEEFSYELTAKMAEMGLFGIFVSPEYGGSGLGYVPYIIAVEEIARVDGSQAATVAAGNSLGIGPIYYFGNEAQKKKWLPKLCTGEMLAGFGLTEPLAGSDAGGSRTKAELDGNEWVLNGSKIFITNAANDLSGVTVVQAVTGKKSDGRKEYSCFLVPADANGLTAKPMHGKMMWRASNTAELYFDDVRLPTTALLGNRGDGFRQMLSTLDGGRLSIGAMGLGGAQGAFDLALNYAQERKQFGQALIEFQATQHKLANMAMEIEAARNLLYKACWLKDEHKPYGKLAAMGKLYCSEVMGRVVNEAVQIHGGYGLMQDYDVERFFRDQKLLTIGEGTSEIQRMVIARHLTS